MTPPEAHARSASSSALAPRDAALDGDSHEVDRARAEENTTRELYARLISLLSQEAGPSPEPPKKSPLESIGGLLRRRWLPMLLVFTIATLGLSRVLKPGRPLYIATAQMLLPPPANQVKASAYDDGSDTVARQYDTEAQIAIITSPRIVERAWAKLSTEPKGPELKLRGWGPAAEKIRSVPVTAASTISENIIDIAVSSYDPEASKRMANIVGGIYKLDTLERTSQTREQGYKFVANQAQSIQRELSQAQAELQRFKERTGVSDFGSQQSATTARVRQLEQELESIQTEIAAGPGAQSIAGDAALNSQRQKASEARAALEALEANFQPTAPRVVEARRAAQAAQAAADARASSLASSLQRRASVLQAQLSEARGEASNLPATEAQINRLAGNVERLTSTYQQVSQRLAAANIARNAYIAVPDFLSPAKARANAIGERTKFLALSILGGLLLGTLAGMLLERTDRGVHSREDLASVLEAPVLGSLPALPGSAEGRLTHLGASLGNAAVEASLLESAHRLRSRIVEAAYKSGVRSILLTSPTRDEEKSRCVLNVAAALAFDGHRVLLVDADFWSPSQHRLAEEPLSPGFAEMLAGSADVEEAVRPSKVRNLWIMTAGARPANIIELMGQSRARAQIQAFEKSFDFVLLDSPPTLSLADAQILSSLANAVALVVADATAREEAQRAEAVLRLTGAHLLGVILNRDKSRDRSHNGRRAPVAANGSSAYADDIEMPARLASTRQLDAHRE